MSVNDLSYIETCCYLFWLRLSSVFPILNVFSRVKVSVVFYDMPTLYFESGDEDALRKTGFSKEWKHPCSQIFLGILAGYGCNPTGCDLFGGNIFEGHSLIPVSEKFEHRFFLNKPVVIADTGLLSKSGIIIQEDTGYEYILGVRSGNKSKEIQVQILGLSLTERVERHYQAVADLADHCVPFRKNGHTKIRITVKQGFAS